MGRASRHGRFGGALLTTAVVVSALWPRPAEAATTEPPAGIHLTYQAVPGCPAREELLEELGRRIEPEWRSGFDRRRFDLRIERLPDGAFSGRLEVTREGRATETRELRAETCRAVSAALVVFIAIALDPASDVEPEPPPRPPAHTSPGPAPPPTRIAPAPPPPSPKRPPLPRREPTWSWSSRVALEYVRAPHEAFGPRVDAQLARTFAGYRVAPALRLSWGFAGFDTTPPSGGEASFRFETARASACALVDVSPGAFTLTPCAGLDLGSLTAKSRNIPQVGYTSTPWSAITGALRASWIILPWLSVDAEVGVLVPMTRTTFALTEPVRIVYRPPTILFSGSAGLALTARFP